MDGCYYHYHGTQTLLTNTHDITRATGVQTYTINQAKVVFLNHRPQAKLLHPGAPEGCAVCCRALREGCTYCSLACKVEALVREGRLGRAAVAAAAGGGCCAGAAAVAADAAAAPAACVGDSGAAVLAGCAGAGAGAAALHAAASDSSDCCTDDVMGEGRAGGVAAAARAALAVQNQRSSSGTMTSAEWAGKRSSDSSCQSFLDWHSMNGHVCRRKQATPRRSPLL